MRILITNDDGIDAPGIQVLERALSKEHDLFIIAPDKQHSGGSHRITFDGPVSIDEVGDQRFSCDGTPADCIRIGLHYVCPDIDWVVSGINGGANLGIDLYLSGTVAAAREATFLGKHSIAVSQYIGPSKLIDWTRTEQLAETILNRYVADDKEPGKFWNINFPDLIEHTDLDALKIVDCNADGQPLPNNYHREGNTFRFLGRYHDRKYCPDSDIDVCLNGSVSISLI